MSERTIDTNGWFEVANNPISKVGVFQYLGKSIPGAEPGKIYNVFRPPEELGAPETLASLRLIPWVDDHAMLGEVPNGMPAEEKQVQGVIGEQIDFDGETLFANIKMFSKALADEIASGKKELSLGYRCKYEYAPGVYNGMPYDYVQRQIRANHLASVDDGRMGPEVSVLDSFTFTFDQKDIQMADETKTPPADAGAAVESMTIEQCVAAVSQVMPLLQKLMALSGAGAVTADPDAAAVPAAATDEDAPAGETPEQKAARLAAAPGTAAAATDADPADDKKYGAAMDARITKLERAQAAMSPAALAGAIAKRDKLAGDLAQHVGTFDHSALSEQQIAEYGVSKLKLTAPKGSEAAVLQGYLQAVTAPGKARTVPGVANAMDSRDAAPFLATYLAGPKK